MTNKTRRQICAWWFSQIGCIIFIQFLALGQVETLRAASLQGTVVYHGPIPAPETRIVKKDNEICGKTRQITSIVVSETGGLQDVVASVEGIPGHKAGKPAPLTIKNQDCRFMPDVSTAMVKQPLEVKNFDPILHNTHIRTETRAFMNVVLLPLSKGIKKIIRKRGTLTIACNKHPFMMGHIHVFDHPYHAVTDTQGRFTIPNLPSGTHTLTIWHQTLGTIQQTITIPPEDNLTLRIEFPAP